MPASLTLSMDLQLVSQRQPSSLLSVDRLCHPWAGISRFSPHEWQTPLTDQAPTEQLSEMVNATQFREFVCADDVVTVP